MDLTTLQLQLQMSPGFPITIQPMISVPSLLPQNLKSFSVQASCPSRQKHFSKIFPVSTHHLIWLLSPLPPPTPIHNTQPLFSAPLSPDNIQLYKQGTWACLLEVDVSLGWGQTEWLRTQPVFCSSGRRALTSLCQNPAPFSNWWKLPKCVSGGTT